MRCPKCNHEMKEYTGLFEKGWDCVNQYCGNETHDIALDVDGNVVTPAKNPYSGYDFSIDSMGGRADEVYVNPQQLEALKKLMHQRLLTYPMKMKLDVPLPKDDMLDALRYSFNYTMPKFEPYILFYNLDEEKK